MRSYPDVSEREKEKVYEEMKFSIRKIFDYLPFNQQLGTLDEELNTIYHNNMTKIMHINHLVEWLIILILLVMIVKTI